MAADDVMVILHDVSSAQRLIDTARVVYGLGYKLFIASKVYGAAATSGVPEVHRMALRMGRSFAVLPSAKDAVQLLSPGRVIVVSYDYGEPMTSVEIATRLLEAERPVLILGGIDAAPSKDVAAMGEAVYIRGVDTRLGPVAEATALLCELRRIAEARRQARERSRASQQS